MTQALAEKLILGLLRKEWPQCYRKISWQVRRLCQKEREQSRQSKVPDREGRESKVKREHGEKRVGSTVEERRFQGREEGQARGASLGEVKGSMSG